MTTDELKQQEIDRQKLEQIEIKAHMEDILPKFEAELQVLCKKYEVALEGFIQIGDNGIFPQVRIRPVKTEPNPYDRK